jgi:hypothetical protein
MYKYPISLSEKRIVRQADNCPVPKCLYPLFYGLLKIPNPIVLLNLNLLSISTALKYRLTRVPKMHPV